MGVSGQKVSGRNESWDGGPHVSPLNVYVFCLLMVVSLLFLANFHFHWTVQY